MSRCLERHPYEKGVVCTRDASHKGGHLDTVLNCYWPAAPVAPLPDSPAVQSARLEAATAERLSRLASSIGGPHP